jgi:hypothetical protein
LIAHFDDPQDVVQNAGLRSDEARRAVIRIDTIIGTIMEAIEALPTSASVTLIVATNHGLLPVRARRADRSRGARRLLRRD